MATAAPVLSEDALRERLENDTQFYCEVTGVTITPKAGGVKIPLIPNDGQIYLEQKLREQREAGLPQRAVILKSRQVGFSTIAQAKLIQRCTTRRNHQALVIAQDKKTGKKLFRIGFGIYASLPEDEMIAGHPLKPGTRRSREGQHLHFAQDDHESWRRGELWPDSEYDVDTASESDAGRGGTFQSQHWSEVAMWENPEDKVAALLDTVPDDPDSLIIAESTARGHNYFKDMWDAAVAGDSGFVPVFWAWHQHAEYQLPFISEQEKERFVIGDHRWGEDEPEMVERFGLTKEQLNWRRSKIARYGNDIATFNQEHPTTPELAFIGTGSRVFDGQTVSVLIEKCLAEDPPARGALKQSRMRTEMGLGGEIQVPEGPVFVPHGDLAAASAPWMLFTEFSDEQPKIPEDGQYVIGVDVSGGELEEGGKQAALHAIQVIDHVTGEQMAEYASRVDGHLLTPQIYLAALLFNNAWVVIERTGGWGLPMLNTLWKDYHYPKVYRKRRQGTPSNKAEKVLGWNTDQNSKASIISTAQSLLDGEISGVHSATLAREMLTYIRDEDGKTKPEPGKFSDRLMAWMIGQKVRLEIPAIAPDSDRIRPTFRAADPITGY